MKRVTITGTPISRLNQCFWEGFAEISINMKICTKKKTEKLLSLRNLRSLELVEKHSPKFRDESIIALFKFLQCYYCDIYNMFWGNMLAKVPMNVTVVLHKWKVELHKIRQIQAKTVPFKRFRCLSCPATWS